MCKGALKRNRNRDSLLSCLQWLAIIHYISYDDNDNENHDFLASVHIYLLIPYTFFKIDVSFSRFW